jgi:hypothetical protein
MHEKLDQQQFCFQSRMEFKIKQSFRFIARIPRSRISSSEPHICLLNYQPDSPTVISIIDTN